MKISDIDSASEEAALAAIWPAYAAIRALDEPRLSSELDRRFRELSSPGSFTSFSAVLVHSMGFAALDREKEAKQILSIGMDRLYELVLERSREHEGLIALCRIQPITGEGRFSCILTLPNDLEPGSRVVSFLLDARRYWGADLTVYAGGAVLVVSRDESADSLSAQWYAQLESGEIKEARRADHDPIE